MKKALTLFISIALTLSLASCTTSNIPKPDTDPNSPNDSIQYQGN